MRLTLVMMTAVVSFPLASPEIASLRGISELGKLCLSLGDGFRTRNNLFI